MNQYDAIVVGARCGGAPLAMLLARAGHRVLLLDRMTFGSDIMSTHYLKRTGASYLDKWGLLDELRKINTPAIKTTNFRVDDVHLVGQAPAYNGIETDFTPRRFHLDKILVDAAIAAGVEARESFTVKELVFDGDRVVGIRGAEKGGSEVVEYAKVVIGADGVRSKVADAVQAEMVVDAGIHTCGHYAYYSGMRDKDDESSLHILTDERRFYITFPTNDELDMVFLFWPTEEAKRVRANLDGAFAKSLKLVPELESRVKQGTRESRISGTHLMHNFFRRAHGPGWALVGDAALHRDPITAQGITNAFTHAAILAEEMCDALAGEKPMDTALADYDKRQFKALKPMFDYTVHLSMLQPLPEGVPEMLKQASLDPVATAAFIGAFLGSVPLPQVFPPPIIELFANDVERGQQAVRLVA
jgi:flavin-dependent dehydrogenase